MADRAPDRAPHLAVVGCGVIGAAWASRMVLCGHDVRVADPHPDAPRLLDEVLANAVTAWDELGLPTDRRGSLACTASIGDAVTGAAFVQESVPERIDLKIAVLREIEEAAADETIIGSSTSGLRPTRMQAGMTHPGRLVVGHPFNPVYLLPLVEVVGGEHTSADTIAAAQERYRSLGMHPVRVRVEIDAFIADRLLEAVWREALWLVRDGVATTQEIDDVITHGFGLRWAQMGLFETYRTAGGTGGFRHFIEQFGPALAWPWSRLTDVPEFTDELVDMIVEQSDAHSGAHGVRELERIRDRNLTGILTALEANRWGAGAAIGRHRETLGGSLGGSSG